jgi:ABC-type polysaccharide/polyol phosphate transport system ATPase subunit
MPIIEVNHVTKEYRLGQLQSLKHSLQRAAAKLRGQPLPARPLFKALDDVDFKVEAGEVLGIIGHNGAGKSTLLKMLAQISVPTRGSVKVQGKVAPLIEVGAGLIGDLTGRENVFLNGAILGISKAEIKKKFDEIVAFAEMEEFINTPIKRYSSGMSVRLGFAIATSVDADILIVDEVLAVGDLAFQRKCFDRMEDLIKRQGKTVLLVSHNIRQVERMCSRVILLDHGKKIDDGEPAKICNLFYEKSDEKIKSQISEDTKKSDGVITPLLSSGELELVDVKLLDGNGTETDRIKYHSTAIIRLLFRANGEIKEPIFGIGVHTPDMIFVANDDSGFSITEYFAVPPGLFTVDYCIDEMALLPGVFAIRVGVATKNTDRPLFYAENLYHFQVYSDTLSRSRTVGQGFVALTGHWEIGDVAGKTKDTSQGEEGGAIERPRGKKMYGHQ